MRLPLLASSLVSCWLVAHQPARALACDHDDDDSDQQADDDDDDDGDMPAAPALDARFEHVREIAERLEKIQHAIEALRHQLAQHDSPRHFAMPPMAVPPPAPPAPPAPPPPPMAPRVHVHVPPVHVHVPPVHVQAPQVHVDMPDIDVDVYVAD